MTKEKVTGGQSQSIGEREGKIRHETAHVLEDVFDGVYDPVSGRASRDAVRCDLRDDIVGRVRRH